MDVYTEILQTVLPLLGFVLFLLSFGWALGIHTRCRDAIEQRLSQIRTKRAIKEALRAPMQIAPDAGLLHRVLRSIGDHLTLRRLRTLGGNDPYIRRLGVLNDAVLLIFPVAEILCILGSRIPLCAWLALGIVIAELPIWFVLSVLCIRKPVPRKPVPRRHAPNEKISVPACILLYGYPLLVVVPLITAHFVLAGAVQLIGTLHLLLARRVHADHFYCMMQNVHHRPMTPQHHSEPFKRTAEHDARLMIALDFVFAGGCFLAAIVLPPG